MNEYERDVDDRNLALALRRLADAVVVPDADPGREAALMAAFDAAMIRDAANGRVVGSAGTKATGSTDAAHAGRAAGGGGRQYWYMAALAAAAAILIAVGLTPALTGRHGSPSGADRLMHKPLASTVRGVQPGPPPPGEFVIVPGAVGLPRMESGSLVRMDVPVSMLISLGVTPPPSNRTATVRADLIVAQDGLPRAIRLVD
jgi:hypothetical protein